MSLPVDCLQLNVWWRPSWFLQCKIGEMKMRLRLQRRGNQSFMANVIWMANEFLFIEQHENWRNAEQMSCSGPRTVESSAANIWWLTFLSGHHASVIEEEVTKVITLGIDVRLPTQAGWIEVGEGLQRPESRLTFRDGRCRTGHWFTKTKKCNIGNVSQGATHQRHLSVTVC